VSHELRTPLGTIRAITSDLQAGTDFDPRTRAELLDTVAGETERLDRLVANLLGLSRIEAGALRPERQPTDLGDIVDECRRRMERALRDRAFHVAVGGVPPVDVDFTQIELVLTNLIDNAARHAGPG